MTYIGRIKSLSNEDAALLAKYRGISVKCRLPEQWELLKASLASQPVDNLEWVDLLKKVKAAHGR